MTLNTLQRHFDDCQLPVEFVTERPPRPRRGRISPLVFSTDTTEPSADDFVYVDVMKQKRVEYFRVYVHPEAEMYLREKRPETRHLMLQLRCFPKQDNPAEVRNFLLGHDERQLFIVQNRHNDTIRGAIEALKPVAVQWAERRQAKIVRQGDWFFIPVTGRFRVPANALPANGETIGGVNARSMGITVGNPHVAEEQLIVPPEIREYPNYPGRTYVARAGYILVRGKIRHSEHSTVELQGWHQAVQNTVAMQASPAIGYYD